MPKKRSKNKPSTGNEWLGLRIPDNLSKLIQEEINDRAKKGESVNRQVVILERVANSYAIEISMPKVGKPATPEDLSASEEEQPPVKSAKSRK